MFCGSRSTHKYTQTNLAPPAKVFPLLCPVREAEWVPGWQYKLIYSQSGVAELGCVFTTPNEHGPETTWIVTEYDPSAFQIAFTWVWPGMVATQIRISLREGRAPQTTDAVIRYTYTGLSPEGNREVQRYDEAWFRGKMQGWEKAINHYLKTGSLIDEKGWE
ncbi:MAG TPA: hypothetical protein VF753_15520 [Terriglobales bacterium]